MSHEYRARTDVLDFERIRGTLKRRTWLILLIVGSATWLTHYYLSQLPDLYRAQAKIVIEGDRQRITRIEEVTEPVSPGAFTNNTQSAVLQSRTLAEKVIAQLGETVGASQSEKEHSISQFLKGLLVIPAEHSSVVTLEYISSDAPFTARALNTLLDVYLEDQLKEKNSITHNATRWLAQRVEEMRNKLVDSENRLEQVRRSSGNIYVEGKSLYEEQLIQLSNDLLAAKKTRSEIETKLQKFDLMQHDPEQMEASQFILESPFLSDILDEEKILDDKISEMRTRYRDEHPYMRSLLSKKSELLERKQQAVLRVRQSLVNDQQLATLRIKNIANDIADLRLPIENENDSAISLRALESEVDANKQLFNVLLARYKETDVQDEVTHAADAKIISRAFVPSEPFEPKRTPVIISIFVLSLIGAVGLGMLLEFTASGFQNSGQLEQEFGAPVVATIPEFTASAKEMNHLQMLDTARFPLYAESIRNLRTALFDKAAGAPPKVLMLSSSLPEEGKSATALSLAVILQMAGKQILLIDADMRRSQLAKSLKIGKVSGLGEYLGGKALARDIIYKDKHSGIFYIPAGIVEGHPLDVLEQASMTRLMDAVRNQFDVILLDTPPVMSVRDATLLAPLADACLYLVRWEHTPRSAVTQGIKLLRKKFTPTNFAVALTRVSLKKQRYYKSGKDDYLYFTNYNFTPNPPTKG